MSEILQTKERSFVHVLKICMALSVLLTLFSPATSAYAQDRRVVSGVVTDSNNEPLIGASVTVDGTVLGVTTDLSGKFSLEIPSNKNFLTVSYIGFTDQSVSVKGKAKITIVLKEDSEQLEEVVVVGYGSQKKESVVGAISQVDSEMLVGSGDSNITNALSGKLSGVLTMQQSGEPGSSDSEIIIRGVSSWNGSAPLVLVDGIERDFTDMDPNEIATISVLKDASATAVFGARGANGVIIVTTREGNVGTPKFKVSLSKGISWATRVPDRADAFTTLNAYNELKMRGKNYADLVPDSQIDKHVNPSSLFEKYYYPDVDWFDELTKPFANVTTVNANVSGGSEFVTYFSSLGFSQEDSLFESYQGESKYHNTEYKYSRFNYRTNLNFKLSSSSSIQLKVGGDIGIKNSPTGATDIWRSVYNVSGIRQAAYYPEEFLEAYPDIYYPDASGDRLISIEDTRFLAKRANPYTQLNSGSFSRTNSMKLFSDVAFKQKLDFITKGLSFNAKVALNTTYSNTSLQTSFKQQTWRFYPENVGTSISAWERETDAADADMFFTDAPISLTVGALGGYRYDIYYEGSLNYNRSFAGKHHVSALALMNRSSKNNKAYFPQLNEAWVGRVTYDFSHRYLFEANVGYTGSERFAPNNRFGLFPSGAVGWIVSEEPFFKPVKRWFNKFKLRYSDGLVGSDSYGAGLSEAEKEAIRFLYISEYSKSGATVTEDQGANYSAQWEEARKQDIGIELGFFDNRLSIVADYFREHRYNMLLTPNYNSLVGIGFKQLNRGEIKKQGYEVEIAYHDRIASSGLQYNLKAMFGYSENRILEKGDLPYAPEYQKAAGTAFGSQANGQVTVDDKYFNSIDDAHIYPNVTQKNELSEIGGMKYLDYNSDGVIKEEDVFAIDGSTYAPYTFSFSGGLKYKNFDFSMVWSGNLGKYVNYNNLFAVALADEPVMFENQIDYWTPDNKDAANAAMGAAGNMSFAGGSAAASGGYSLRVLDFTWQKADYIKLKDVNLGYTFNSKTSNMPLGIKGVRVYLTANNLLLFTTLGMGDPESKSYAMGNYPQMTNVKLGLNLNF